MYDESGHCQQSQELPKIYSKTAKSKAKMLELTRLVKRVLLEIINSTLNLENYTLNRLQLN
jgi:hypothetical protein